MNRERMVEQLILHEGLKLKPYQDTLGIWTWLVGYNLEARGIEFIEDTLGRKLPRDYTQLTATREDAIKVLRADIDRVEKGVRLYYPEYDGLDDVRQRVIIDLAFNMALKLLQFKRTIAAAKRRDWSGVARGLYESRWAKQVDDGEGKRFGRADRLAEMVLTGVDYTR